MHASLDKLVFPLFVYVCIDLTLMDDSSSSIRAAIDHFISTQQQSQRHAEERIDADQSDLLDTLALFAESPDTRRFPQIAVKK